MSDPLRVVVADDHLLVRSGICALISSTDEVCVVAEAGDADGLLVAVEQHQPDAVVTDIRMPPGNGMDGILAALEIRRRWPDVGVVVLSQHLEDAYAHELFAAGSAGLGYLLKERIAEREELLAAIRLVAAGGSVLDSRVVDRLVSHRGKDDGTGLARLAPREREVLSLMAMGLSNPSIAERMHLSLSSVEKHVSAIFGALDLVSEPSTHRRVAAVIRYLQEQ